MFTTTTTPYYQPSGRAPVGGLLIALIVGILAAWILSFPYIYIVRYIPSIYICAFATLGYGFLLGWIVRKLVRVRKIRSHTKALVVGIIVAAAAVYFQWVFFAAFIFSEPSYPLTTAYIEHLNPTVLFDSMRDIYHEGTWTFGKNSRQAVNGPILGIIWLVEAGIIIVMTAVLSRIDAGDPYSETLDRWADEEKLPYNPPYYHDIAPLKAALETGDMSPILTAEKAPFAPCSEITFHTSNGDDECYFMTLSNLVIAQDKKGKESRKLTAIVEHLRITPAQHAQIRAKFGPTI